MSQTNEFAKAISPDYVYFDLQATNTYNNETGTAPQLQFIENRDGAIVDNAGEYNMSVTRFSVDTTNLPVLVVEPDLKGTFDPHRSVHKVAIITTDINFKVDTADVITTVDVDTEFAPNSGGLWGQSVASSTNGGVIIIGEPEASAQKITARLVLDQHLELDDGGTLTASGRGQVYICASNPQGVYSTPFSITDQFGEIGFNDTYAYNSTNFNQTINDNQRQPTVVYPYGVGDNLVRGSVISNWKVGINVAVSGDGMIVFIGTGAECPYYFIYNRGIGNMNKIDKYSPTRKSVTTFATNHDGTLFIVGYPNMVGTGGDSANVMGAIQYCSFNTTTNVKTNLNTVEGVGTERNLGTAVAMNGTGNTMAYSRKTASTTGGTLTIARVNANATLGFVSVTNAKLNFGNALSFNNEGSLIAVGASTQGTTGEVVVYPYTYSAGTGTIGSAQTAITPNSYSTAIGFGTSVALSYDGAFIHIGAPSYTSDQGLVQTFQYSSASNPPWVFKTQSVGTSNSKYGTSLSSSQDAIAYVVGAPRTSTTHGFVAMKRINVAVYEELPSSLIGASSIASVNWFPDNTTSSEPTKSQLTGTNTATFPYYHCHSYSNFIDRVNVAIKDAYVANFNRLWTTYVSLLTVSNADLVKAEFINIVARCFSTPPYLEWNASLDPTLYLNNLFSALGNYYNPSRTFSNTANANVQASTIGILPPLFLKLAFNASLYSLFAGFPATETIINNEKFFIINVPQQVPVLVDNSTIPLRALPLIPEYPFLYEYHNALTGAFSLPFPTGSTASYALQDYFIQLRQEISTIDAWCPIGSIVFTSNQLPIIVSQFSSSNTVGNNPNIATIGNRFALVITDLMTNQQGYRPNVIYNPTAEYRRLSLTGNIGIRNIDIAVFWRSKTGQLLPFRLPSGGSASLKLLFEKKNRNPDRIKEVEPDVVDIMGGRMPKSRR
jgi:hypothetical protein